MFDVNKLSLGIIKSTKNIMNKIQYIKLLELRGITDLKGMTVADAVKMSGGSPTEAEMVQVNKLAMDFYIGRVIELEKEKLELGKKLRYLEKQNDSLQIDSTKLNFLQQWGVDNWEGYDLAMEAYSKECEEEQ